ncbi:DUF1883 domain-containing protein [Pseudomonas eucalypticola]|uniref:ADP-ribosyl cyclase/cyclic ADP-ribose hydrolase n=1 Tax=Pseudomonas eucalypticola TaxID=2599595 RepID=A0A7D5D6U2_9PSED|nr:DUF1883 domain-containing protein [Pseudomonas eucalypticola]QKZ04238.1 DUF1883 domain-containing protein [Pseudomonas eucalypticola]
MSFLKYDLGSCSKGDRFEVTLTRAANVMLLSSSDFSNYQNRRRYSYVGGLMKRSPAVLGVPRSGHWYIVVDMQGLSGSTKASVRKLPDALPEYREVPLTSIPSLVRDQPPPSAQSSDSFDVFISHASEDKDTVVRALASALINEGLNVWYDELTLRIGDSLRQKIDRGLAKSRVGLVVLSRAFIAKGWTNYELDGIVSRTVSGEQILLPIWHDITKQEVIDFSPSLSDKVARNTATHTVEEIASEIAELLRDQ